VIDVETTVLSAYSLRYAAPEERFDAARQAGFSHVGFGIRQFRDLTEAGETAQSIRRLADRHGVVISEIEALKPWWGDPAAEVESRAAEEAAWRMADAFGSRYVQAVGPYVGTIDDAAEAFAGLCDRAAEHGLVVGLELLPFTNVTDASIASAIVDGAARPNGGVCVDVWHHFRGADDPEMIRSLGARRITAVQLDDGTRQPENPDYYNDCLDNRRVPGEGEFDLVGFLRMIEDMGVDTPVSIEVISTALQALPAAEAARRMREGFLAVLAEARS
jgi:sugar phosphate isomerase/epimerase